MSFDAPENTSGQLFKSFVIVTTCYILFVMMLGLVCGAFFHEAYSALGMPPEEFEKFFAEQGDKLFPRGRFLPIIIVMAGLSFAVGWLIVKISRFSKMGHAVFLALLAGVTLFQIVFKLETTPQLQWLFIVLVGVCPIGILIGARWAMPNVDSHNEDSDLGNDETDR